MLLCNVRNNNKGFTLIETLIIVVIIGILSAVVAPSFLGMLNRNKVNAALVQLRGALKEVQRNAIRNNKSCTLTLNTTAKSFTTNTCVVTGNSNFTDVAIRTSNSSIAFTFKGRINSSSTIVIASSTSSVSKQKCLVIAAGIGIMRTGDYDETDTTGTDSEKCITSQ